MRCEPSGPDCERERISSLTTPSTRTPEVFRLEEDYPDPVILSVV